MVKLLQFLLVGMILFFLAGCKTLRTPVYSTDSGAIRGYDPVAYFTQNEAVKGNPEFSFQYNGASWYFDSEQNLQLFKRQPDRYAPQYGGYCAYAMSNGNVVPIDPDAFSIENDKLYLNFSLSTRKTWLKDVPGYVTDADMHWQQKISSTTSQ